MSSVSPTPEPSDPKEIEYGAPVLTQTNWAQAWDEFVIAMRVCWALIFLLGVVRFVRSRRRATRQSQGRRTTQSFWNTFALDTNIIVASLRIALFVDARGWEGVLGWRTINMLQRVGECLILMLWSDVIAVWWVDLGSKHGKNLGEIKRSTLNSNWRVRYMLFALMLLLMTMVIVLTSVAKHYQDYGKVTNGLIGVLAVVVMVGGLAAAVKAVLFLKSGIENNRTTANDPELQFKIQKRTGIMLLSLLFVPLCVFGTIGVSIIRGSRVLTPKMFFLYLVVRGICEVLLCGLAVPSVGMAHKILRARRGTARRQSGSTVGVGLCVSASSPHLNPHP